jgi:chloramphenicol 3-O-phosphotransferase
MALRGRRAQTDCSASDSRSATEPHCESAPWRTYVEGHTRGVWLFEHNNAKPREVQELLGVSSIALVDRYTRSMKFTSSAVIERGPNLTLDDVVGPETPLVDVAAGGNGFRARQSRRSRMRRMPSTNSGF